MDAWMESLGDKGLPTEREFKGSQRNNRRRQKNKTGKKNAAGANAR
jgi:hypothetical protein